MNRQQILRTTVRLVGGTVVAAVASAAVCFTAAADTTDVAGAGSTMINFDLNQDGRDDSTAYDLDQNGVYERLLYDQTGDTVTDFSMFDDDQDGRFERAEVDRDHDGAPDLFAGDPNEDQVWDTIRWDYDQDGIDDRVGPAETVVGPPTNLDPTVNLLLLLAEQTGQATFGTPDSDHDGYNDNDDYYPANPDLR